MGESSSSSINAMEGRGSARSSVEESIEKSKCHWSQVREFDSGDAVAEASNVAFFRSLQWHPKWGSFFMTFGEGEGSWGELVLGRKFAEGGQAELYDVQIEWLSGEVCDEQLERGCEYVLKVFKEGTFLCHLQALWPQGMLQFHAEKGNRIMHGWPLQARYHSDVIAGTLLEDGRFAFLMIKEQEDLRSYLDRHQWRGSDNMGPLSKEKAMVAMYEVAYGMNQLHDRGIVHHDLKASNVLLTRTGVCVVADFECSVGVVGTGFFRAPEILEACKHRNVSSHLELFTKAVDVYSYGMICYEILTGKLPFEGHPWTNYDLVIKGGRLELPSYVAGWIRNLLSRCWHSNPTSRPSFGEILEILAANSWTCKELCLRLQGLGFQKNFKGSRKIVKKWRLLRLKLQIHLMYRIRQTRLHGLNKL